MSVVLVSLRALAAPADRREGEAKEKCAAGDFQSGVALLAKLYVETGIATYVYNQARCFQQNGQGDPAVQRFREYLRINKGSSAQERQEIEGYIRELEAERKVVPPSSSIPAPAVAEVTSSSAGSDRTVWKSAALIAGAAGVVALGAGVASGIQVGSVNRSLATERASAMPTGARYTLLLADGQAAQTRQWIFLSAGAAALIGAGVCYLVSGRAGASDGVAVIPWLVAGGAGAGLGATF